MSYEAQEALDTPAPNKPALSDAAVHEVNAGMEGYLQKQRKERAVGEGSKESPAILKDFGSLTFIPEETPGAVPQADVTRFIEFDKLADRAKKFDTVDNLIFTNFDRALAKVPQIPDDKASALIDAQPPANDLRSGKLGDQQKAVQLEPVIIVGEYQGEVIKKDIPPAVFAAEKGDTAKSLARMYFSNETPPEIVEKYAREIARVNHIKNIDQPVKEGTRVRFP